MHFAAGIARGTDELRVAMEPINAEKDNDEGSDDRRHHQ